jgi:general secretion pathway protein G
VMKSFRGRAARAARRGFTLIELLVVLVILALLAGLVLPRFLGKQKEALRKTAIAQISTFKTAISMYALDNGQPPATQQGLEALISEPTTSPRPRNWKSPYLDTPQVPLDPWGNPYQYTSPGPNGEDFYIVSFGADGREGGTGDDADVDTSTKE